MSQNQDEQAAQKLRQAAVRLRALASSVQAGRNVGSEIDEVRADLGLARFHAFGARPRSRAGEGGIWRVLDRMKSGLGQPFHREELAIVSMIDDWARRIRELRVEHGYDVEHVGDGFYVLHSAVPDAIKAGEWRTANEIRNLKGASVTEKLEKFFLANVGRVVRRDQLDYIAKDRKEATRRARELRDEQGWPIISHIDDPGLRPSEYMLVSDDPADWADPNQRYYPTDVRMAVFKRDGYRCKECKRTRQDALAAGDTRFILECDHVIGVADPAGLTDEQKSDLTNLRTLCHRCHAKKTGGFQRMQRTRRRRQGDDIKPPTKP